MRTILGLGVLATIFCASPVVALEAEDCLPLADMNQALKAAGQRSLVIGDRDAVNDAPELKAGARVKRYANIVTSNEDGSLGFQIEGDLPRATASTRMCVAAKLTNIRLFDARKPGTQPGMLLGGAYDTEVRQKEKLGTRPMIIADTLHRKPDGSQRIGLPMILFGNIAGRSASLYARMPDGKAEALMLMGDTDYTPVAIQRLNAKAGG